jgi:hypothetical protein
VLGSIHRLRDDTEIATAVIPRVAVLVVNVLAIVLLDLALTDHHPAHLVA